MFYRREAMSTHNIQATESWIEISKMGIERRGAVSSGNSIQNVYITHL